MDLRILPPAQPAGAQSTLDSPNSSGAQHQEGLSQLPESLKVMTSALCSLRWDKSAG